MEIQSITNDGDNGIFIKNYKIGVDQYKKRLMRAQENINNYKTLDTMILSTSAENTQREKLINNEEIAWNSFEKLQRAKRETIEMESISIDICKDIHSQTEKMKGIGDKVGDINKDLTASQSLISRMLRRHYRNKAVIAFFSIGLFMTFLVIIYFKMFSNNTQTNTNSDGNLK
jgi:hypothetical protein